MNYQDLVKKIYPHSIILSNPKGDVKMVEYGEPGKMKAAYGSTSEEAWRKAAEQISSVFVNR